MLALLEAKHHLGFDRCGFKSINPQIGGISNPRKYSRNCEATLLMLSGERWNLMVSRSWVLD
jgi:hypothetical protein